MQSSSYKMIISQLNHKFHYTNKMPIFQQQLGDEVLSHPFLLVVITLFIAWMLKKRVYNNPHSARKLPPSPPKLPVIGNLHQLSELTHRALQSLGAKHGPIMLLHFGSRPVIVLQSADAATEFIKNHDLIFSDKPQARTTRRFLYDLKDVIIAPYGEYWRRLKSICVLQLLSSKRVQSISFIREEETDLLMETIESCCSSSSPVNLSELFDSHANNVICRAAFGRRYSEGESGKRFLFLLREMLQLMAALDVGEFVPWLSWISRVNGLHGRVDKVAEEIDCYMERVVEEHLNGIGAGEENRDNFVDILLNASIDRDGIKAILLDMLAGGTDTTSATLEWAMTEVLKNPGVLKKLRSEITGILKGRDIISDEDLEKMHYLKAVIKETLRLHSPVPILGRLAREDVTIMGYEIAAKTLVITNIWGIGRDPASWDEPEEFNPDRFLNSGLEYKGLDFKFIPFGYGRRGCPGIALSIATVELLLANLVLRFEWKLPGGMKCQDLDVMEHPGITLHRKHPLLAVPTHCIL